MNPIITINSMTTHDISVSAICTFLLIFSFFIIFAISSILISFSHLEPIASDVSTGVSIAIAAVSLSTTVLLSFSIIF
jgi:hypothetical protein